MINGRIAYEAYALRLVVAYHLRLAPWEEIPEWLKMSWAAVVETTLLSAPQKLGASSG